MTSSIWAYSTWMTSLYVILYVERETYGTYSASIFVFDSHAPQDNRECVYHCKPYRTGLSADSFLSPTTIFTFSYEAQRLPALRSRLSFTFYDSSTTLRRLSDSQNFCFSDSVYWAFFQGVPLVSLRVTFHTDGFSLLWTNGKISLLANFLPTHLQVLLSFSK